MFDRILRDHAETHRFQAERSQSEDERRYHDKWAGRHLSQAQALAMSGRELDRHFRDMDRADLEAELWSIKQGATL